MNLKYASRYNLVKEFKKYLKKNSKKDVLIKSLYEAVGSNNLYCTRALLKYIQIRKKHKNKEDTIFLHLTYSTDNKNIFHYAIYHNNVSILQCLIHSNVDINTVNKIGMSPLIFAIFLKKMHVINFLLEQKEIDINKVCLKYSRCLWNALIESYYEATVPVFKKLIMAGANTDLLVHYIKINKPTDPNQNIIVRILNKMCVQALLNSQKNSQKNFLNNDLIRYTCQFL